MRSLHKQLYNKVEANTDTKDGLIYRNLYKEDVSTSGTLRKASKEAVTSKLGLGD